MDLRILLTVVGSGLAIISSLILLIINGMRTTINKLEASTVVRMDKQDLMVEKIKEALGALKDTIRDREEDAKDLLGAQIESAEVELRQFQTRVLTDNVVKSECRCVVEGLKQRILILEKARAVKTNQ